LGLLLSMCLTQKGLTLSKALLLSIVAGFVISLTIELLQYFLPTRTSSMPDLIANTMGTGIGTLLRGKVRKTC
jgi:VanZ family protein